MPDPSIINKKSLTASRSTAPIAVSCTFPAGAPREVLTFAVTPKLGPVTVDLLVLWFTVGPVGVRVSVLAILGVVLAYLLARSLF